jgi:glycolate oxidase iron-sulfur subunit
MQSRTVAAVSVLDLDPEALNACVSCGLCLPHCPTYRVTGREIASPRGRIAAMRAVEWHGAPIDAEFRTAMEECVACRGCEAACPSSVPFGALMEETRAALPPARSWTRRMMEWLGYRVVLPRHWLLLMLTTVARFAQRLRLVPARLGVPQLTKRKPLDLNAARPDAWLFTGCVMDAWLRETHRAAVRVIAATGASVATPGPGGDCCGALHVHAGRVDEARRLARRVIASMPGDAPVVVDSAGCGAAMKEYGQLLDDDAAHAFSARVRDFAEWIVEHGVPPLRSTGQTVVVQDPCHLRHVQRAHLAVWRALEPAYTLAGTDDDGLCCGAGGAYAVMQPTLSGEIRDRKVAALHRASGNEHLLVASANPGCLIHLRAAGIDARHPADLLADALEEK